MSVRAKFVCNSIVPNETGAAQINFGVVYSGSPENDKFFQASPGGQITLWSANPEATKQFEMGKEYYVDFTEAAPYPEQPSPVTTA